MLSGLIGGFALLLLIPVCVLFTEVTLAVTDRRDRASDLGERRRLAVLIPAHNEAAIIADTLQAVRSQLEQTDRLVVVADNCSDNTASVATAEGAEAVERKDLERRGKGFALDFGVNFLTADPPDIVIIVDADCIVAPGCIDRLARVCGASSRPTQGLYLMHARPGTGKKMKIAEFAWAVRNQVRPAGLHRIGIPCHLMGSGMAFPWYQIRAAELATGHIVEDLKLGLDLARIGAPPLYCPDALITSEMAESTAGIEAQRTRWEHGHIATIVSEAPRLIRDAVSQRSATLLALALDVTVPPLALLTLLVGIVWSASCAAFLFTRARLPLQVASLEALLLVLSILLAWARYGRNIITFRELSMAVVYALWKLPIYVNFVIRRQTAWIRSKRGGEE
jgi:cellulose synthase/poly-beta-1,6-N-acetylglucosamine synthase-like glycosyltransferase